MSDDGATSFCDEANEVMRSLLTAEISLRLVVTHDFAKPNTGAIIEVARVALGSVSRALSLLNGPTLVIRPSDANSQGDADE